MMQCINNLALINGPPTHSVKGGQTSNGHWCLSSLSVGVCTLLGRRLHPCRPGDDIMLPPV